MLFYRDRIIDLSYVGNITALFPGHDNLFIQVAEASPVRSPGSSR